MDNSLQHIMGSEKLKPFPLDPTSPQLPSEVFKCPRCGMDQFKEESRKERARFRGEVPGGNGREEQVVCVYFHSNQEACGGPVLSSALSKVLRSNRFMSGSL